jgi:hypothetical protein
LRNAPERRGLPFGPRGLFLHEPVVRISLSATALRPGETVSARVENHGTGGVGLESRYSIEVYEGAAWIRSPISPLSPDPLVGLAAGPGGAATYWSFPIPAEAPPSLYRLVGEVIHFWDPPKLRPREIVLTPEFSILPLA